MNEPQAMSPRARLQELLAIPESRRTDAQWDEIHELEINLSSANKEQPQDQRVRQDARATTTGHPKPHGGAQGKRRFHKGHKKKPRQDLR